MEKIASRVKHKTTLHKRFGEKIGILELLQGCNATVVDGIHE